MAEKKITKKEMFNEIIKLINAEETSVSNESMVEFLEHEIELLNKKHSGSSNSKKNTENLRIENALEEALKEMVKPVTITEFTKLTGNKELAEFSNQRLSAFMKKLVDSGRVVRTTEKKKSVFTHIDNIEAFKVEVSENE